mgnify:CR=1 FL=1
MNRITDLIQTLNGRVEALPQEKQEDLAKTAVFDFEEFVSLQNLKSAAQMSGLLSLDEAQTVYMLLGEGGPDKVNKAPVGTRCALLQLLKELLGAKVKGRL